MPKPGYKSITIKEELYENVEEQAKKEGKSVSQKTTESLEKALEMEAPAE